MMQIFIHYSLHFIFPLLIAFVFFRKDWKKVSLIMLSTMMVNIDYLISNPIYQEYRCSINFHPLHKYYDIVLYMIMIFLRRPFNIIGIGLFITYANWFLWLFNAKLKNLKIRTVMGEPLIWPGIYLKLLVFRYERII